MSQEFIRKATENDLNAITRLVKSASLPLEGVGEYIGDFLVAELDGNVIGSIGLEIYGEIALVRSAVVSPSHQRKGIGTLLYDALLNDAKKRNLKRLVLLTNTAEEYFRRKGFVRIERSSLTGPLTTSKEFTGACPSNAVCMELSL